MIELYNDDCLRIMPRVAEKSIDLIVCDLPYGVTANRNDIVIPFAPLWKEYERIIKDNGCIALFAQGLFYVDLVNSKRELFRYDLIWDKILTSGFLNANKMPLRQHEQIAIFYKELPTFNPQFSKGNPVHNKGVLWKTKEINNNNYQTYFSMQTPKSDDKFPKSIVSFQKPHPSRAYHPTQKPVELLEYLIRTYSNEGDLILDNCMGSGTTGVACKRLNRNFIGIELDKGYFDVARQRIDSTTKALF